MDRAELLKSIISRYGNHGISTAAQCLKAFDSCLDGGFCPRYAKNISNEQWHQLLKDAESKFVYCAPGMNIKGAFDSVNPQYAMEFNCVISSRRKDRDGDILLPDGATLDPNAPLLWQHNSLLPIGRVLGKTGQNSQKISGRCAIAKFDHDSELAALAKDAMTLIQCNGLRISHGFEPKDFTPLDDEDGRWLIRAYDVYEVSAVSIPSNVDAIIESFSRGKLHSPIAKDWAKSFRKAQGIGFEPPAEKHPCHCGGTCDECKKDAAAHQHGSVRHEGESLQDCVSRKIQIMENEGGDRSHEQIQAIAYSLCGEKALANLGISRETIAKLTLTQLKALLGVEEPRKEPVMSTEVKPVAATIPVQEKKPGPGPGSTAPAGSVEPASVYPYTNTTERYEDNEGNRPQGPSQGDHDWHDRHMAQQIVEENLPGVQDFNVGNTADDEIMAIAAGGMTGAQQNPAPDTALAGNDGPKGQPGVPTPTMGVQAPIPMPVVLDVSTSPGPQGSRSEPSLSASVQGPKGTTPTVKEQSVNDARQVTPMDRDSADQHDTAGNIDTHVIVDVPHLKSVAGMIQHSGKEGNAYLNPDQGHVHHVAHPDDLHPSNQHMYHGHDEIHKLYKSVRGVKSVKVAIQQHPSKGMGYTLIHKHDRVPGADPGMGDGTERVSTNPVRKNLFVLKGALEHIIKHGSLSPEHKKLLAVAYVGAVENLKYSGLNPGGGAEPSLPSNNDLHQHSLGNFTNIPANNAQNTSSASGWRGGKDPGIPAINAQNVESATGFGQAPQVNTPESNPPTGGKAATAVIQNEHVNGMGGPRENVLANPTPESRRIDPGTMSNESLDGPNIPGSLAFRGNVLNEDNVMDWLDDIAPALQTEDAKEFDEMFSKEIEAFEAKEFDEMFAK